MRDEPLKILALGAGRQSSTVLGMSCLGEIERIDHGIFADTRWESQQTYNWLYGILMPMAEKAGIPIHVISIGDIKQDAIISQVRGHKKDGRRWASMPYFVKKVWTKKDIPALNKLALKTPQRMDEETGAQNGNKYFDLIEEIWENGHAIQKGMIRRQCTYEYKIRIIEKKCRELAGYKPYARIPTGEIELWKGISLDEANRASMSDKKWLVFHYPLIERRMTVGQCIDWWHQKGWPSPPRSSCIGCVYHSKAEWRNMRDNRPDEWAEAVAFDKAIRKCGGMRGDVFLHADRVPLDQVDLSTPDDFQEQLSLFRDECQGVCGI